MNLVELFIGGMHQCVKVVDKWIFGSNLPFLLPLTKDNLDYCWSNDNQIKGLNCYRRVLKSIGFLPKYNNKASFRSENS